jgi:hypothetical protein
VPEGPSVSLPPPALCKRCHRSLARPRGGDCAEQHLLGVGSYDLDRIRVKLPRTPVERFERLECRLCGSLGAFRVSDVDSPLQTFHCVPIRAEQSLEEIHVVCRHTRLRRQQGENYGERGG